ncbi:heme-binding protein [Paenibacillus thiaminolyticus]|uniref:GlcG/HbpS family heme-binding protein n=1 Tax=Paenibacillus thiaminolyticus TaxID=49283 RepID=UPI00116497F7|nr:heme-binding protein [Paenibacillus thiaminolyticus]NGP59696.1 heme-binding protein [Paenibacillus thiaminolyticus]
MIKLTLDMAKLLIAAAERKSRELGLAEVIAIVDEGTNLIALHRMDNARIAAIDIALNKAWTSAAMKMPTSNLSEAALPGGPTFGINTTNQGRIVILGGGIPLVKNGIIVGGIGVSGGTSAQDIEVANAAVQAFESIHGRGGSPIGAARIGTRQSAVPSPYLLRE